MTGPGTRKYSVDSTRQARSATRSSLFFANGGHEAVIVRIAGADEAPLAPDSQAFADAVFPDGE